MAKAANLFESVRQVLLQDWDPIGVRNVPQAQDEYDIYANSIATMLATSISISDLSKHLLEIETQSMGLAGNPERALVVAAKLRALPTAEATFRQVLQHQSIGINGLRRVRTTCEAEPSAASCASPLLMSWSASPWVSSLAI